MKYFANIREIVGRFISIFLLHDRNDFRPWENKSLLLPDPLPYRSKVADWDYSFQIQIYLLLIFQNRNRVGFFINRIGVHFTLLMLQLSFCLRGGPTAHQSKTEKLICLAYFCILVSFAQFEINWKTRFVEYLRFF